MGDASHPWRLSHVDEGSVTLTVAEPTEVRSLLASLVGSKAMAGRIMSRGGLERAGAMLRAGDALASGDEVCLRLATPDARPDVSHGAVSVLFEDRVLLAADKPAGILVHGDGRGAETLTARVAGHLAREGRAAVPQAVQRLDTPTTGIVLFCLAEEFQPILDAQVAGHGMRKRYLAVVEGRLAASERGWMRLEGPIARDRHDARRMRVGRTGKPALTLVRTVARRDGRALLLVELRTGRRHQIRVHLAHEGHPIVGDELYGGARHADGLMLHAWSEEVRHPLTSEGLVLRTPFPARFRRLFDDAERRAMELQAGMRFDD